MAGPQPGGPGGVLGGPGDADFSGFGDGGPGMRKQLSKKV
jgi:hypothetical protein